MYNYSLIAIVTAVFKATLRKMWIHLLDVATIQSSQSQSMERKKRPLNFVLTLAGPNVDQSHSLWMSMESKRNKNWRWVFSSDSDKLS